MIGKIVVLTQENESEAIGIFKIENKVDFFQTYLDDVNSYDIIVQKGISTKKIDKECLILNTSDTQGTIVFYVDNNNYDAQYIGCSLEEGKI